VRIGLRRDVLPTDGVMPTSPDGVLFCGTCAQVGRCRLGIAKEWLDHETFYSELTCPSEHDTGGGLSHGGWTASVLNEICGHAAILSGTPAVMGTLSVRFVRPVAVGTPLTGRVRIDGREGRKVFASATLVPRGSDVELATATAVLIAGDPVAHHDKAAQFWAAEGDEG
jgi:acyl-coenzyme A thioesterase PaaI-like protein